MKDVINNNAKVPYEYKSYWWSELNLIKLAIICGNFNKVNVRKGKHYKDYVTIYSGFDIETTTMESNNGYMYIWQISIGKSVIKGRTWEEFRELIHCLELVLELTDTKRLIIWVANLSFEWQFIRKHLVVTEYFFKTERSILTFTHNNCIEFREALTISGGSLSYLAKTFTNTQKSVDDLDYSIKRNRLTKLTPAEESYCDNDVLILAEWSEYIFNEYIIPKSLVPLTIQSVIRKDIEANCKAWWLTTHDNCKNKALAISSQFPSESVYHHIMTYCFRGGYVHGRIDYVGKIFTPDYKIGSVDFTSSYPSVMEHSYMPNKFYKVYYDSVDDYLNDIRNNCVIANITFVNLKPKTLHSIESKSKCMDISNDAVIDNGRIRSGTITVCLTELDYRIYEKFYSWDEMIVHSAIHSKRIKHIPNYVLKGLEQAYTNKAVLKSIGANYSVPKQIVNSYYGVTVQKLIEMNVVYEDEIAHPVEAANYEKQIERKNLLPQWGIYITAHARYNLLSVVYSLEKAGSTVLYMDTDSIKFTDYDNYKYIIELYNNRQLKKNKQLCMDKGLDFNIFNDLGCLNYEGRIYELKYYGAKRYITTMFDSKKKCLAIHQTIAGLPKTALWDKYHNRKKVYTHFRNNMFVGESGKLTAHYNDNEVSEYITDEQGNTCLMTELSNVGLSNTDFTMKMDLFWIKVIEGIQDTNKFLERR